MALQSKMTVYVAIAGVLALMGGIVGFASLDTEELERAEIRLTAVELRDVNNVQNQAKFDVTFHVKNPTEKTFTVAEIGYQLYGDGELLGSGQYSTADIALPGRALFTSGAEIPLKNTFTLSKSEINSDLYQAAVEGGFASYAAEGMIVTQTSWGVAEKEFRSELN